MTSFRFGPISSIGYAATISSAEPIASNHVIYGIEISQFAETLRRQPAIRKARELLWHLGILDAGKSVSEPP